MSQWRHISTKSLKSPVTELHIEQLVQSNSKGNIKASHYWPLVREITGKMESPHEGTSNAESIGKHCTDVIMSAMAVQITSIAIVNSTVYSRADWRKHQSSASLVFVPVTGEFPAQRLVTRKMFPFGDVIIMNAHQWELSTSGMTSTASRLFRHIYDQRSRFCWPHLWGHLKTKI